MMKIREYDKTPVPQASTVEIGTQCVRNKDGGCKGCAFKETHLQRLSSQEIQETIISLSRFWDYISEHPNEYQLIGDRIVELLGGAGIMNQYSSEDLKAMLETAKSCKLSHLAFLCDAQYDQRAIQDFFRIGAQLEKDNPTDTKNIIALSVDALPKILVSVRDQKSQASLEMIANKDRYIVNPETQNFRVFTTISKQNAKDIPEIARRVLESGSLLFIAPLTIHSQEAIDQTGIKNRLLMGTDTEVLLTEEDLSTMKKVVAELQELKEEFSNQFSNTEENFDNMLACCKKIEDSFVRNCATDCQFTTKDGEKLIATPNIRVMKKSGEQDLSLGICTCFAGPTKKPNNYANIALNHLQEIAEGKADLLDVYRRLTKDLIEEVMCPGCNCRTAIPIARGTGLVA